MLQAIRDAESRVMFTGYDPLRYKLAIWTLSAVMCGIAGALYVPQVGIINPSEMSPAASIEIAIWAAVGGRGTLIGPIVGAFFVNGAKSWFTQAFPEFWLYVLGALFIAVTLFLPQGIVGLCAARRRRRALRRARARKTERVVTPDLMRAGAARAAQRRGSARPPPRPGTLGRPRGELRARRPARASSTSRTARSSTSTTSPSASTASRR